MKSSFRSALVLAAVTFAAIAGCYSPTVAPGTQACGPAKECADGQACGCDGKCYLVGKLPSCGSDMSVAAGADMSACVVGSCSAPTPVCNQLTGQCVGCMGDTDCPLGQLCTMGACVPGCNGFHSCGDAGVCDVVSMTCKFCKSDNDCSGATPRCSASTGACVPCLPLMNGVPDNCKMGTFCSLTNGTYQCSKGCNVDNDCAAPGTPDGGAMGGDGGAGVITSKFACCNHACIDVLNDSNNCGTCSSACAMGTACCAGKCATLASDLQNCGKCGNICGGSNASYSCTAGACAIMACTAPFADCDKDPKNGCEVNLNTDAMNCSKCATPCALKNAMASCMAGVCAVASCSPGFGDCNKMAADGCEDDVTTDVMNCGKCGAPCGAPNQGVAACTPSNTDGGVVEACTIKSCNMGFADCDKNPANGCEANLSTDAMNCGACGKVCQAGGGVQAVCKLVAGVPTCGISACGAGTADCNGMLGDGCEVDITKDPLNCNGCGNKCPIPANASAACINKVCGVGKCVTVFLDCDKSPANGCEVDSTLDVNNCGKCGTICPAVITNGASTCKLFNGAGSCVPICNAGYSDCNNDLTDGCEALLASDAKNCGSCGIICPNNAPFCSMGKCGTGVDYGPMHSFTGLTTDHYITQGGCSVGNADADAQYFCKHFYGDRLGQNCLPKPGYGLMQTPNPTYPKMHKNGGCTSNGNDIPNTVCQGGACKIGNWSESTNGLVGLVCHCQ